MRLAAWVADAAIIVTYWWMNRTGELRPFNIANAFGAIPLLGAELVTRAWELMPLTCFFGAIGWWGLLRASDRAG